MHRQSGFTLIEIAVVLVIIGLLLGGVLKGQELITSARVRNLISQQDGIKAAFYGFQDRFRAVPGDYNQAIGNINNATQNGNGDGSINTPAGGIVESILAWEHLSRAGFISGAYTFAPVAALATSPTNPWGVFLELNFDNVYFDTAAAPPARHNLKTGGQVPVDIIAEVDRKVDDGNGQGGTFRYSQYQGNAATAPGAPGPAPACITAAGVWNAISGNAICGGASLL